MRHPNMVNGEGRISGDILAPMRSQPVDQDGANLRQGVGQTDAGCHGTPEHAAKGDDVRPVHAITQ